MVATDSPVAAYNVRLNGKSCKPVTGIFTIMVLEFIVYA